MLQNVNIIEEPEFWLMFHFLGCFTQEGPFSPPSASLLGVQGWGGQQRGGGGDHKGCGTQGQQVGNFQKQVTWLLSILAQCHQRWDCW